MEKYMDFFSSRYFIESNNYDDNLFSFDDNDYLKEKSKYNEKHELINNIIDINEEKKDDIKIEIEKKSLKGLNNKDIIKERNKVSAKRYRERIKEKIINLEKENKKLKEEMNKLKLYIENEMCIKCKEKYENIKDKKYVIENKNNCKNKKVSGLFTVICICFLIIGYENLNKKQIIEILHGRKLINDNQKIDITYYNLTKLTKSFGKKTLITFGDYYSILQNNFLGRKILKFKNKGKIRILNGYENIDNFNETCENCVVDVSNNVKINNENPLYFRLFIVNSNLTENIKDEELKEKANNQIIEITCKVLGISQNFLKNG
jgi:hypothetical protein